MLYTGKQNYKQHNNRSLNAYTTKSQDYYKLYTNGKLKLENEVEDIFYIGQVCDATEGHVWAVVALTHNK